MTRLSLFALAVAAFAAPARGTLAQSHGAMPRHGLPAPIIVDRRVGPYVASVWADPDIGIGTIHVVLQDADGSAFTPPSSVRVAVVPVSGRLAEVVHEARPERARRGARFMTEVAFDRAERWNVRVIIEGAAGGGQLVSHVEARPDATLGPLGLMLSSVPFLMVAVVWWRAAVARNRLIASR